MELRHLRYFLAICETGSFSRAANLLHVTQPTLSHQIRQLEDELGTALLHRLGKRSELTPAGEAFRQHCMRAVREVEAGVSAVAELEGLMRGTLSMTVFHAYSHSLLPSVLSSFAEQYPGVHVVARQLPYQQMLYNLVDGKIDLAIAYAGPPHPQVVFEPLFDEPLALVVGARHPLAGTRSMPMARLADIPLVLLTPEFGARAYIDAFFAERPRRPRIVLEMNAIEPILATIRDTGLATVLTRGALDGMEDLRMVRLTRPAPRRTAGILWRYNGIRSTPALKMAEMIKEAYRRHPGGRA